jgi:acyl-ACP thioesterase
VFAEGVAPFQPVRVSVPRHPEGSASRSITVSSVDLDPMGHVNNARYLDYLVDAWGAGDTPPRLPRSYAVEYVRPAEPEARMELVSGSDEGGSWARLSDSSGVELVRARGRP